MSQALNLRSTLWVLIVSACLLMIASAHSQVLAQATGGIDFSQATEMGDSWLTFITGNPLVWFFTTAFIIVAVLCALNRAPWAWLLYIFIGALIGFGAPRVVADLTAFLA